VTYTAAIEWLFGTQDSGIKLGLDNVRRLLSALADPQAKLRCIHVAGTNGKGSVCAFLDSIARAHGIRTGLFTSPHLVRFNERIQINGVPIQDEAVVSGIERIRALIEPEHHPTFFEITTALAFDHFQKERVELAILETGLGGRLDATNVVIPLVSVLTSIDLDHQHILGDTLAEIAGEKAAIIKPRTPVVSGPQYAEVRTVIDAVAAERSARLEYITFPIERQPVGLAGSHQKINAAIALAALRNAGVQINDPSVSKGLASVSWPGRFQRLGDRIVLDGAHNPSAIDRLVTTWKEQMGGARPTIVFGGLRDKNLLTMSRSLTEIAHRFLAAPVQNRRAMPPTELVWLLPPGTSSFESLADALASAKQFEQPILITGSLFLVGEALSLLQPSRGILQRSNQ
jgi:dihydrofolate synthase / folylpolyglutamate synthase